MKRVLIIGSPGAGKSTTARNLAVKTRLPIIHLDYHYWHAGWVPTDEVVWREKVLSLAAQDRWIMDGVYGSTLEERIRRADTIIHLDFATWLCLWRVTRRMIVHFGRERPGEFVTGCPERFSLAFFRFVLRYRRHLRSRHLEKLAAFGGERLTFRRPSELRRFLAALPVYPREGAP